MPKLVIEEFSGRERVDVTEHTVTDFTHATQRLVRDLWDTSSAAYSAAVLIKWFAGPPMVGDEQPFNVRQYGSAVGEWTDFLYRL